MKNIAAGILVIVITVAAAAGYTIFCAEQPFILSWRIDKDIRAEDAVEKLRVSESGGRKALEKAAGNDDPKIRHLAVNKLASNPGPSIEIFTERLADSDEKVRVAAVKGLTGCKSDTEAIKSLVTAFFDSSVAVKQAALSCFETIEDIDVDGATFGRLVAALKKSLKDQDKQVRISALKSLDNLEELDEEGDHVLAECLEKYNDSSVRIWAALRIGKLGSTYKPTIDVLCECLGSDDLQLATASCKALAVFGDDARKAGPAVLDFLGEAKSDELKLAAFATLKAIGFENEGVFSEIGYVLEKSKNQQLRLACIDYLSNTNQPSASVVNLLILSLRSKEEEEAQAASIALQKLGPYPVPALIRVLSEIEEASAAQNLLHTLESISVDNKTKAVKQFGPREKKYISDILDKCGGKHPQYTEIQVLAAIGPEQDYVIPKLISYLEEQAAPKKTQARVAALLGSYGSDARKAVWILYDCLFDDDNQLCLESINALKSIELEGVKTSTVQKILKKLSDLAKTDREEYIRQAAADAYEKLYHHVKVKRQETDKASPPLPDEAAEQVDASEGMERGMRSRGLSRPQR